ncbi:Pentatricopeptide repeat [Melia azedarach]|uniref:Pentatricopeptide repeat n=1 Tax=Melia azedarach TaxID=155640 RepID=A0ACC1YX98_MELAZ|nr:Pentatricopeptide repeat [Melia azedarach]
MPVKLHRLLSSTLTYSKLPKLSPLSSLQLTPIPPSSSTHQRQYRRPFSSSPNPNPNPNPNAQIQTRTRTPLEKQFETWIQHLKPGFTPSDVVSSLQAQSDPDLALDIFRWTSQRHGYRHNHETYLTIIQILISGRRYRHVETLLEEVLAGNCEMSVPLYNSIIRFCCNRKLLFNRAFDAYKKMLKSENCKPTLETFTLLLSSLLRRFNKLNVCYVYLHSVRSLTKQMKSLGVIPDTFALNMIIKAYAKCLQVDEAIKVLREMGLYGCEPNSYTYSYIAKGLCEKGRVEQGFGFYKEMKEKQLVPSGSCHMILICSLAMERRFEDAVELVFDMLGNSMGPDMLTYKTLLEGLCREGRGSEALDLLEEFRRRDVVMGERNFKVLLNALHFLG